MMTGLLAVLVAAAGQTGDTAKQDLVLLRCQSGQPTPCFVTEFDLGSTRLDSNLVWRATFRGDTAVPGIGRRSRALGAGASHRLLILVDVSGSMRDVVGTGRASRFGLTRAALRDFLVSLDSLPPGSVKVAIAPFGSRQVAPQIQAAAFGTPADAQTALDRITDPRTDENTGLYSAVDLGVRKLESELKTAGGGGLGVLLLVSDGVNQVFPARGDDPDLLDGAAGLDRAVRAVERSSVLPSILGINRVDESVLRRLAGPRGQMTVVKDDGYEIDRGLARARDLLWRTWEVSFSLVSSREELGRSWALLGARAGKPLGQGVWTPPTIALPAFEGTVPTALAAASSPIRADRRWLLAPMLLVMLTLLWGVLPRYLWPVVADPQTAPVAKADRAPVPVAGALRAGLQEVPPRRPTDVTAAKARRG